MHFKLIIAFVEVNDRFQELTQAGKFVGLLVVLKLLLASLAGVDCILKLAFGNVVEAHAHKIVGREPRHHVSLFD